MKSFQFLLGLTLLSFVSHSSAFAAGWDGYNNPSHISKSYLYNFNSLPMSGQLPADKLPWSETYWPSYKGGIAVRWQLGQTGFNYKTYSHEALIAMGPEQIAKLSPAEKFDILNARYDYPTVASERRRVSPNDATWEGICHGWTPAALLHREPEAKSFTNPDGIEVRFGSSDIKALITYYYGVVNWDPSGWIGQRCKTGVFGGNKGCKGVNPGTLQVVLSNQLGLMGRGFVADVDRGSEVWNQPVYGFKSQIIGRGSRQVVMQTQMFYANELRASSWSPQHAPVATRAVYRYTLELNSSGQIVGGKWQSKARPGYLWQHETNTFKHPYYGAIKGLLNDPVAAPTVDALMAGDSELSHDEIMTMANESLPPSALGNTERE